MCPRNVKHFFAAANGRAAVAPAGCGKAFFACHHEEFSSACGAPEATKISVVVPAKAGTHCGAGNKLDSRFRGKDAALE